MQAYYPAIATLFAYLIGSLPFAVIISRWMGLADPRRYGSGNPGATNVLRSGNAVAAALTLAFDALKGYGPVLLVRVFGGRYGLDEGSQALVALASFAGHLWPVFLRFRGGKGVSTAAGILLALNLWLGLAALAIWGIIALFFRYVSLASIVAAVVIPFYQLLLWGGGMQALVITTMSLLLLWRHSGNINRLLAGTERQLRKKDVVATPPRAPVRPRAQRHRRSHAAGRKKGRSRS